MTEERGEEGRELEGKSYVGLLSGCVEPNQARRRHGSGTGQPENIGKCETNVRCFEVRVFLT